MSGKAEENAAELKIGDEFLKAKCVMNCEVSLILDHKLEQLQAMSDDPSNQVSQVFEKSLHQLAEFELCVLGNLCLETVEEAIAMVPSIKSRGRGHEDEAIEKMLNDMSLIKKFE
nr:DNA-directed RNA polymerase II subunit 4 [Tanacetum cinerariifolium]